MEPQPLNFQIKQLEREIGFALFSHRENRTHLTAAGAAFLVDIEELLASADRAVAHAAQVARGESGLLRIGATGSRMHAILAPAIKHFRDPYPDVAFDIRTLRTTELERALNRQELDLGFTLLPVPDENFDALTVFRSQPFVAVAADHALGRRERVAWSDLNGREAISFEHSASGYQRRMDDMLAEHGVRLTTAQHADSIEAALAFVGVGLGVALVPLFIGPPQHDNVVFVRLPEDAAWADFGAIWRRDEAHPLRSRFLEAVTSVTRAGNGVAHAKSEGVQAKE
jgi:DNA-binding transcriptional LysR family regulator